MYVLKENEQKAILFFEHNNKQNTYFTGQEKIIHPAVTCYWMTPTTPTLLIIKPHDISLVLTTFKMWIIKQKNVILKAYK